MEPAVCASELGKSARGEAYQQEGAGPGGRRLTRRCSAEWMNTTDSAGPRGATGVAALSRQRGAGQNESKPPI